MVGTRFRMRSTVLVVLVVLAAALPASAGHWDGNPATGTFTPTFAVNSTTISNSPNNFEFTVSQSPNDDVIASYDTAIPRDFRFSVASVRPADATVPTCASMPNDVSSAASQMEVVGPAGMKLETTTTQDPNFIPNSAGAEGRTPGPAIFVGGLFFLGWNASSSTATLCGLMTTGNIRIDSQHRVIVFQATLALLTDGWKLSYNLSAVPGAIPGTRSITDSPYFQTQNSSVIYFRTAINGYTSGNYNLDANGKKTKVLFSQTPILPNLYDVVGTFTPCASTDTSPCRSGHSAVTIDVPINITTFPLGVHPAPTIVGPKFIPNQTGFSIVQGTSDVTISWNPPDTNPSHGIKGFALFLAIPNQPSRMFSEYLISDPTDPGYAAATDPCVAFGPDTPCSTTLHFPLVDNGGSSLPAEGLYSVALVSLFKDGHRSDGRCDDGTVLGSAPPCFDGSTPAAGKPGIATSEFLLRSRQWKSTYVNVVTSTAGGSHVTDLYVLFVDFANHQAEFDIWRPYSRLFVDSPLVLGNDAAGGIVVAVDNSGSHIALQIAVAGPAGVIPCPGYGPNRTLIGGLGVANACGVFEIFGGSYNLVPAAVSTFAGVKVP